MKGNLPKHEAKLLTLFNFEAGIASVGVQLKLCSSAGVNALRPFL